MCLTWLNRYREAEERAREALALARQHDARFWVLAALREIAAIAALRHEVTDDRKRLRRICAARILGFADAGLASYGERRLGLALEAYNRPIEAVGNVLGSVELSNLMNKGPQSPKSRRSKR